MKKKLERKVVTPSLIIILTDHAILRMRERMPVDFSLPDPGSYVRLLTMQDTFHDKKLILLKVRGGAVMGRWNRERLIVVTMFSEETFHRFQKRNKSRFLPLDTACYRVAEVITPAMQKASRANAA